MSLALHHVLPKIAKWANQPAVWKKQQRRKWVTIENPVNTVTLEDTGVFLFQQQSLFRDISIIQLNLGTQPFILKTPPASCELDIVEHPCGCCFALELLCLGNTQNPGQDIWIQFLDCAKHTDTVAQYTFSRKELPVSLRSTVRTWTLYKPHEALSVQALEEYTALESLTLYQVPTDAMFSTKNTCTSLEKIYIYHCDQIVRIELHNEKIKILDISWCDTLTHIDSSTPLVLTQLRLRWCPKLQSLTMVIFSNLRKLNIEACPQLPIFPSIQECSSLENLHIAWYLEDIRLPDLSSLHSLRFLTLRSLSKLHALPNLPHTNLEFIDISECTSLEEVELHGIRLREFVADGCKQLRMLDITNATKILSLSLARVSNIEEIKGLEYNSSLQKLHISTAPKLTQLHGLSTNFDLVELILVDCSELEELPQWHRLIQLRTLEIYGCGKIAFFPQIRLPSLENLHIGGCLALQHLPTLELFPNVRSLKISWMNGQQTQIDLRPLSFVREIKISGHQGLTEIIGLGALAYLRIINFSRCQYLRYLEGLEHVSSLRILQLQGCSSLEKLPNLRKLDKLAEISISHCSTLQDISSIHRHPRLHLLDISHCTSLQSLPTLHPKTLASLKVLYCGHVTIPIDLKTFLASTHLALEELNIENSTIIHPEHLRNCPNLLEITGLPSQEKWAYLLQIATQRKDISWIAKNWTTCVQQIQQSSNPLLIESCLEALSIYTEQRWITLFFDILQKVQRNNSTMISTELWYSFFETIIHAGVSLEFVLEKIISHKTLKIDLKREHIWFRTLVQFCVDTNRIKIHASMLEKIYQHCLYKKEEHFVDIRNSWCAFL